MDKKSMFSGMAAGVAVTMVVLFAMGAGPAQQQQKEGGGGCRCGAADDATYRMVVIGDRFAVVLNTDNGSGKVVDVQRSGSF